MDSASVYTWIGASSSECICECRCGGAREKVGGYNWVGGRNDCVYEDTFFLRLR